MESLFVPVDGARIHCWKAGTGPPLLMIHGLIADGGNWELNVPALAALRTVYAVDLVNMGRSARVAGAPAGLAATADWVARLLDALGIAAADLVGSSHGGAVCLMVAARHPARVKSMLLFDPANPFCRNAAVPVRFWNSGVGAVVAWLLPYLPRFVVDIAHKQVYGDPSKAQDCTLEGYRTGLNRTSIRHLRRLVRTWWEDMAELERALPGVAGTSTLLVWGEQDRVVSYRSGVRLAEAIGAELVGIGGVGHLPFVEAAAEANGLLVAWFGGLRIVHPPVT